MKVEQWYEKHDFSVPMQEAERGHTGNGVSQSFEISKHHQ